MFLTRYFTFLFLLTTSCNQTDLKFIEASSQSDLKKERLGESTYYVKFPSSMFIEETRGKEGQLGYGLWLLDTANRYTYPSGFIEIEHGRPHGWKPDCDKTIGKVRSSLFDGTVKWDICKSDASNYYSAIAYKGSLTLSATSRTQAGLDSMISIIATLSLK